MKFCWVIVVLAFSLARAEHQFFADDDDDDYEPQGRRDDYNAKAVNVFLGKNRVSSRMEMTPSKDCIEGDMAMTDEQREVYFAMRAATAKNRERVRRAESNAFSLWPENTVTYKFHSALAEVTKTLFEEAVEIYKENTCLNFIEVGEDYTGDIKPLNVQGTKSGCTSTIGGPGGTINLQNGMCNYLGTVLHEIGHALGIYHEQSRPDRSEYVKINEENVMSGYEHNFEIADRFQYTPYDLHSIMHYSCDAFSKDGVSKTMSPVDENQLYNMGKQEKLTQLDILRINLMYSCLDSCPSDLASKCLHGGVPSKSCTCSCPDQYTGAYCEIFNADTECTEQFFGPSGTVLSPNYPDKYSLNSNCNYAIECGEDEKVSMTFTKFNIEAYSCFYDTLDVKIGNIFDETYSDTYCGKDLNGVTLVSKKNLALMSFHSDDMYVYKGFSIEYECIQS